MRKREEGGNSTQRNSILQNISRMITAELVPRLFSTVSMYLPASDLVGFLIRTDPPVSVVILALDSKGMSLCVYIHERGGGKLLTENGRTTSTF